MGHFARARALLGGSVPLFFGSLSTVITTSVDSVLAGRISVEALAGTGIGGYLFVVISGLQYGIAASVQRQAAELLGARQHARMNGFITFAFLLSFGLGLMLMLISSALGESLVGLMSNDPTVVRHGVDYLRVMGVGIPALLMLSCWESLQNARKRTKATMYFSFFTQALNLGLTLLLFSLSTPEVNGVAAIATGSVLAFVISAVVSVALSGRDLSKDVALIRESVATFDWREFLKQMFTVGYDRQMYMLGFVVLFYLAGKIGTDEVAVLKMLLTVILVPIFFSMAVGRASLTEVARSIGHGERGGWHAEALFSACVSAGVMVIFSGFCLVFAGEISLWFFADDGPIALATRCVRLTALYVPLYAFASTLGFSLHGANLSRSVMVASMVSQWIIYLPLCFFVALPLGYGLEGIVICDLVYRGAQLGQYILVLRRDRVRQGRVEMAVA